MTPQELIAYIEGLIIDNTTQQVTPYKMRSVLTEIVNSLNQSNISSLSAVLPLQYDAFTNTLSLPVINNLTAGGTNSVLSAEQGKVLKQLIDDLVISGGGIPEAPIDGTTYGRKDGAWEAVGAGAVPTLQEVTDTGANTTNPISVYNNDDSETVAVTSRSVDFINPDGLTGVSLKASTQTGNVGELLIPDVGLSPKTIATEEYVSDLVKSNLILYPTTASSDIGGYAKLVSDVNDADYNDTAVDVSTGAITGSNILISSLASVAGILSGQVTQVNVSIVGNIKRVSGTANGTFYFEIYHRDSGGTETLIGTSDVTAEVSSSSYVEFSASALIINENFNSTDRLVYKFYGNKVGGGSNPTFDFQFGGTTPVRILNPVSASLILAPINEQLALKENSANKSTSTGDSASSIKFPVWSAVVSYVTNALASFKTTNFLDFTSSGQTQLDSKQDNAKLISANYTALNNDNLIINATCTITDVASPTNGTNYTVTIINGSVTIGGFAYTQVGSKITRIYNSGSWRTFIDTEFIDYSNISTIVGFASYTTKTIHILLKNGIGTCFYHLAGVSNSTTKSFTLDRNVVVNVFKLDVYVQNNSTISNACGRVIVNTGSNVVDFRFNASGSGFTNVNNAAVVGQFDFIY